MQKKDEKINEEEEISLRKEISRLKELMEIQERHLSFEEECYLKLKAENKRLKSSYAVHLSKLSEIEIPIPRIKEPNLYNLYDMVVHIDSFQKISWLLENHNISTEEFSNPPNQIVIGIMGRENVGKSHILGKLSGVELPVGYAIQTQGLSIKYSKKDNILTTCLDSAGVHAPVYYYDPRINEKFIPKSEFNKPVKKPLTKQESEKPPIFDNLSYQIKEGLKMQMISDRRLTETFIEDFILFASRVIIIVVGQLTQADQTIIERIRREYKEKKFIIIVHNFMYLSDEESIKSQIQKDIFRSCEVEERVIPGSNNVRYYCEKQDLSNPFAKSKYQICHFVYCQENTKTADLQNNLVLTQIWNKVKTIDERDKFNVFESLRRFFRLNFKNYLKVSFKKQTETPELPEEKDSLVDLVFLPDKSMISLAVRENFMVSPQNPTFTALGSLIVDNLLEISPNFALIEFSENQFLAICEICNLELDSLKIDISREFNNENMLVLKGEKIPIKNNKKNFGFYAFPMVLGGIKYGCFEKMIAISGLKDAYELVREKGITKCRYRDGVLMVFFNKKTQGKGFKGFRKN